MQRLDDARDVERHIEEIFAAASSASRESLGTAVRRLFVEALDFHAANGEVSLAGAAAGMRLPDAAERIAELDGVQVALVRLPASKSGRVRKDAVVAAARALAKDLGDDLLLAVVDERGERLQLVLPSFEGARPTLRRMTVERDLARRTAVQQVSKIYWRYSDSGNIRIALRQAFDVEPVTREFFEAYKRIFAAAEASISGFPNDDNDRRMFVLTLFNRLMFVYFLQRKGWLHLEEGEGKERRRDYDYLNALWNAHQASGDSNFYKSRLQPLFFNGLNNPDSRNLTRGLDPLIGHVPFLNGGLFERTDPDKVDGVVVPDAIIERVLSELFDRFNFTVMESTPFDIEVAVDPEMLGKVFEELVTGRHSSGAYYTPRQVVSFMCGEALKGYLKGQVPELDDDAVERFVNAHDTDGLGMAQARRIADALAQVTVADPACGSGAYLLGMMQELIELQSALYNAGVDAKSLYELKLEIIQRNLYGVDIDEFAVNIAMLRLWLSLAIEHDGDAPEPLPNLDLKIVQGDSLGGPDPSAGVEVQGTLGQDVERVRRLGELKGEYLRESDGGRKQWLRGEIESLKGELRAAMGALERKCGVVDWRVEFAEVFAGRGGFDVAIANPPYVRQELIGSEKAGLAKLDKAALVKQYGDAVVARSDLYCYFYARGLQLLRKGGMHVFVCSNSWLDVSYGAKLQEYLLTNAHVQAIYESAVERQFATADINTIISVVSRNWARSDE